MSKTKLEKIVLANEMVLNQIYVISGQKVMPDSDFAELFGVKTKQLQRQVRRNIGRVPDDFMFELTREEYSTLRSQFGTLKQGEYSNYLPIGSIESGVAML